LVDIVIVEVMKIVIINQTNEIHHQFERREHIKANNLAIPLPKNNKKQFKKLLQSKNTCRKLRCLSPDILRHISIVRNKLIFKN